MQLKAQSESDFSVSILSNSVSIFHPRCEFILGFRSPLQQIIVYLASVELGVFYFRTFSEQFERVVLGALLFLTLPKKSALGDIAVVKG